MTMLKFAYFRVFLITFGLPQGPLRSRTSPNMIFGMSFDGLMTSARKRNGSKKSQSLGSEIMCHPTLKVCTVTAVNGVLFKFKCLWQKSGVLIESGVL